MESDAKQTTLVLITHKHKNTYADKSQKNSADQVEMLLLVKALELQAKQKFRRSNYLQSKQLGLRLMSSVDAL